MYRGQCRTRQANACLERMGGISNAVREAVDAGRILTASVFHWRDQFFFNYESVSIPIAPVDLFGRLDDLLNPWPGEEVERYLVPLIDIFHCVEPHGLDHWRRKKTPARIFAQLARLKPEMVSSYIFYHYQLQEEKPGSFDKYCLIGLNENLLFFYLEHPFVVEPPPAPGKLSTSHSPANWQEVMNPHFEFWEDAPPGQEIWREIETIFTIA
jgi:hypothetical protein